MENIVNTNNTNLRLCALRVGLFNTLRVSLPMVSPDATNVQVLLTNGTITTAYSATKNTDGVWICDIDAAQFSAISKQKYEVAYKLDNKQFWDGQGWVNIVPATTSGIIPQPVPPPHRWAIISITQGDITHYADENGDINLDDITRVRWDNVIGKPDFAPVAESGNYNDLKDVPTEFPPEAHTHTKSQITDFPVPVMPSTEADDGAFAGAKKVAEFVNSSINNLAAYYLTYNAQGDAFPTKAALDAATTFYNGGVARSPTKNDYLIVLADEEHTTALGVNPTTRYVYDGTQWAFQYVVNNTSLTQAQVDAINSGITALLVNWLAAFKGSDTSTTLASVLSSLNEKIGINGGTISGDLSILGAHIEVGEAIYANSSIYKYGGRTLLFNFDSGRSGNFAVDADFSPTNPAPYVSALFSDGNTYLTGVIDARLPYPLYSVPSTGLLKNRAINTTNLASVIVPNDFTDLLIRASVTTSLPVAMPDAITTKYGDTFPAAEGEYLITITKTGTAEAYVRVIKLEVAQ